MRRIAIIDDHELIRHLLRDMLVEEGYAPILIEEPGDLLAQLAAARPDLVLLDLLLGTWGDGLALAAAIRRDPLLGQVPLIVMSAALDLVHQHAGTLADLRCHVLEKPFNLDDLSSLVEDELDPAWCSP